jgi:hypothetical protein
MKRLEARVRATNRANAYANELWGRLINVFKPFEGMKIEKVGGSLLAKIQKLVDGLHLPNYPSLNVYRHRSSYSLAYVVKTCEVLDGNAYYYETVVPVGEMLHGVLTHLGNEAPNFKVDYSADKVMKARSRYEFAKQAAREAESALIPFGEYDR